MTVRSALVAIAMLAALMMNACSAHRGAGRSGTLPVSGDEFMMTYHADPQPALVEALVVDLDGKGVFELPQAVPPVLSFMTMVFRHNPGHVDGWSTLTDRCSSDCAEVVQLALWAADTDSCRRALKALKADATGARKAFLAQLIAEPAVDVLALPLDNPSILDMLWAAFMATGDEVYLARLAEVLDWDIVAIEAEGDLLRGAIYMSAEWSIRSNCEQQEAIRDAFAHLAEDPETPGADVLREILDEVP